VATDFLYTNKIAPNSNRTPILHPVTINFVELVIAANNRKNKSHLILSWQDGT